MGHEEHTHTGDFWARYLELISDPAHWLFELTANITFDIIIISFIWGVVIKKILLPRWEKRIHRQIDEEHGIEAHD